MNSETMLLDDNRGAKEMLALYHEFRVECVIHRGVLRGRMDTITALIATAAQLSPSRAVTSRHNIMRRN